MPLLDSLISQGWPQNDSRQLNLSLYLHFLYRIDDDDISYEELLDRIEDISSLVKDQIQTLGLRLMPSNKQHAALGVWTCNMLPNVTRLYVDSSLLPPLGEGETSEEMYARMEEPKAPKSSSRKDLPLRLLSKSSKVEAFALAGSSLYGIFGHLEGLYGHHRFIKDTFPNIERLYILTMAWQQDGTDMHDQLDRVIVDFDAVTNVKLIVNIVIQGAEPASWCATQASVYGNPNGSMSIKSIVVDQMHGNQDVLALMHRVIDDIDAEWAPEAFSGYRWPPSTRPRYTVGIPSRSTQPNRMLKLSLPSA